MLLNDIGKKPDARIRQINRYLGENYGIKLSPKVSDEKLQEIFRQVHEEITQLKIQGNVVMSSPEISKRLLVLEGIRAIKEARAVASPVYASVMRNLVDYVVDHVQIEATGPQDFLPAFEEAIKNAMREYRSSKYRFPDDIIERELRDDAISNLKVAGITDNQMDQTMNRSGRTPGINEVTNLPAARVKNPRTGEDVSSPFGQVEEDEDVFVTNPKTGRAQVDPFAQQQKNIRGAGVNPRAHAQSSLAAAGEEPIVRNPRTGRAQRNPFAQQQLDIRGRGVSHGFNVDDNDPIRAKAGRPGIGESAKKLGSKIPAISEAATLVKRLRCLLETEVSQAEVMMAAKGFAEELQEMVEKIGRLQNEDLPPVTDQMRQTYGTDSASAFQTQIYEALQGVMDALYTAKSQVDAAVESMAQTGGITPQVGMDVDMSDELPPDDLGLGDLGGGAEAEGDLAVDDLGLDADLGLEDDEFGGAEEEDPLGRAQKESVQLQKKVLEMQKLVNRARKLKEAKKVK